MRQASHGISAVALLLALAGSVLIAPIDGAQAQTTANTTPVNNLGLSTASQTSLDNALAAVATAMNGGSQADVTAALQALEAATKAAIAADSSDPNAAVDIATALTQALPSAAASIAEAASAADPTNAANIAVAVYNALPSDLQTDANKTVIANAVATGAGVDVGTITTALGNLGTTNLTVTLSLAPAAPPPPVSPQ